MNDVDLELQVIKDDKIDKFIKETVEKCLNTKCAKIVIEDGSKKGDNFQGSVYRILYGRDSDAKVDYSSLFLKLAPKESIYRENQYLYNIFAREIFMYSKALPFFEKFQQSKGIIPDENGFCEYAKFYSGIDVEWSECVLLEDLKRSGFEMLNYKVDEITYDHVSLAMKAFGKFHAISFALRDQQPDQFDQLTCKLSDMYLGEFFDSYKDELINLLEESEDIALLEKLNMASVDGFFAMGKECVSTKNAERFAVICHGDAWVKINNMMYKNDSDRIREVRLIDWQYSNYTSPAIDLVLYLMCSLNKELRDKHYEEFLHIYHGSLCDMLIRLGSDPSKLFSFEDLLEQLHRFGRFALLPCAILLKLLSPSADDLNETARKFRQKLRTNARDMIADLARSGYI